MHIYCVPQSNVAAETLFSEA